MGRTLQDAMNDPAIRPAVLDTIKRFDAGMRVEKLERGIRAALYILRRGDSFDDIAVAAHVLDYLLRE